MGEPALPPLCYMVTLAGTNFLLSLLSSTPEASGRVGPAAVMRAGELALPPICSPTWKSRHCTSPRQHGRNHPDGSSVGEQVGGHEYGKAVTVSCLLCNSGTHPCPLPTWAGGRVSLGVMRAGELFLTPTCCCTQEQALNLSWTA